MLTIVSFVIYKVFFLTNTFVFNFLGLAMPLFSFALLVLFIVGFLFKNWLFSLLQFITIVLILSFFQEIYSINIPKKKIEENTFSLMSYNVGTFNLDRYNFSIDKDTVIELDTNVAFLQKKWVDSLKSDIICFQEFYNNDQVRSEKFITKLVRKGYKYYYTNPIVMRCFRGFFGLITFSKYPIVKKGTIVFDSLNISSLNKAIYTDLKIENDTIRVINVHLHSMSIRINFQDLNKDNIAENIELNKTKLDDGFKNREMQIRKILNFIEDSPHEVVLAGDFNDIPQSYTYQITKQKLKNAFENAGNGFGFTYNKFPNIIRIDHHFYSSGLQALKSEVLNQNNLSDHFPVLSTFYLENKNNINEEK